MFFHERSTENKHPSPFSRGKADDYKINQMVLNQQSKDKSIIGFKLENVLNFNVPQENKLMNQNKLNKLINIFKVSQTKRFNLVTSESPYANKAHEVKYDKRFIKNQNYQQQNINNFLNSNPQVNQYTLYSSQLLKSKTSNSSFDGHKIHRNQNKNQYKDFTTFMPKTYSQIQKNIKQKAPRNTQKLHFKPIFQSQDSDHPRKQLQINQQKSKKYTQINISSIRSQQVKKIKQNNQEVRKYLQMNISRYRYNQLKSFHQAILQFANGDAQKLRKGLINVLNLSGILIQEESLDLVFQKFQHRNDTICKIQIAERQKQIKEYREIEQFNFCKQRKNNKVFKQKDKKMKIYNSTKVEDKKAIKRCLALQMMKSFQNFIELYKMIQNHYFKQSTIDYLGIILGGCVIRKLDELDTDFNSKLNIKTNKTTQQMNLRINQNDLYESFRKRYNETDTMNIVNLINQKIHLYYQEYIKLHNGSSILSAIKNKQKNFNIKYPAQKKWQITLGKLYNLFYSDNQLCQHLYEYYLRQLQNNKKESLLQSKCDSERKTKVYKNTFKNLSKQIKRNSHKENIKKI